MKTVELALVIAAGESASVLPRIKARLYFGHATNDRSMAAEAIAKLDHALAAAFHSWTVWDSPVYNEPQANRAFDKLTKLLAGTLKQTSGLHGTA